MRTEEEVRDAIELLELSLAVLEGDPSNQFQCLCNKYFQTVLFWTLQEGESNEWIESLLDGIKKDFANPEGEAIRQAIRAEKNENEKLNDMLENIDVEGL